GECAELLARNAADGESLLLLSALLLLLAAGPLRRPGLGELGDEVAHLLDLLLGFFLVQRLDRVLDLFAGRIHRFEFERRHNLNPRVDGGFLKVLYSTSSNTVSRTTSSMLVMPAYRARSPASRRPGTPRLRTWLRSASVDEPAEIRSRSSSSI